MGVRVDYRDAIGGGVLALLDDARVALAQPIPMPRIGAPPPKELRLFRWGKNPTTKGSLRLTKAGARKVMQDFEARGHAFCFDLWHSTFDKTLKPEDKFAVGHYRLELRDGPEGGLYAVDIQWVPRYAREISEGKWPFISPAPLHTKDGEIIAVKNSALVTDPATLGAQPTILTALSGRDMSQDPMKRLLADSYSGGESMMRNLNTMAAGDGPMKDLAAQCLAGMAPVMDAMRASLGDDMETMRAELAAEVSHSKQAVEIMTALSEAYGLTDLAQLRDRIVLDKLELDEQKETAVSADEKERQALLADASIPPGRLPALKLLSLPALREKVKSFAAKPSGAAPSEPMREQTPRAPVASEIKLLSDARKPDEPALMTLSDQDRFVLSQVPGLTAEQLLEGKRALEQRQHSNLLLSPFARN